VQWSDPGTNRHRKFSWKTEILIDFFRPHASAVVLFQFSMGALNLICWIHDSQRVPVKMTLCSSLLCFAPHLLVIFAILFHFSRSGIHSVLKVGRDWNMDQAEL